MRICKNCGVRIEMVECADGVDRWMHKVTGAYVPTIYEECRLPKVVAEP